MCEALLGSGRVQATIIKRYMSNKELTAREMQSRGGIARAKKLSAERRREIASQGGQAFKRRMEEKKKRKGGTSK
jgi:hypothetical protein